MRELWAELYCSKCGARKKREEFKKDHRRITGRCSWCKTCSQQYLKGWRKNNKSKLALYMRKWRAKKGAAVEKPGRALKVFLKSLPPEEIVLETIE